MYVEMGDFMSKFTLSAFADEIDENLKIQMDVLEGFGINHMEMRGVNGKNITQHSSDEIKEIKRQLDDRGFRISAIGSPIGKIKITDPFSPHLDLFKHTMEIANILGTKYIRIFSFFIPKGADPREYRNEVIDRVGRFIDAARESGLILLHENEKDIYGDTAERCLDLLTALKTDSFRATFDPANFVQCDVETYPAAYELLKDYIEYVHIKDALYCDHSVVPSGLGDGRVKEVLTALAEKGFEGFLSLEPHLGNFKGFSDLEQRSDVSGLPEGGPKRFAIALQALQKILEEIEKGDVS